MPSFAKKAMMTEIEEQFGDSPYAFISQFETLDVASLAELRNKLNKVSKRSMVVKHTFAKKVFEKSNWDAAGFLGGSVLITFGDKDPQDISKEIVEFSKSNDKFKPSGVIFESQVFDDKYVKQLAKLPSRHELLTQVVVRMQSPITGVVMTLNQVVKGFLVALNEVKKLKEGQAQSV